MQKHILRIEIFVQHCMNVYITKKAESAHILHHEHFSPGTQVPRLETIS